MFSKKEKTTKEKLSKELELYKAENYLEADKNIQERKVNNWKTLDEVRRDSYEKIAVIKSEIAKLEGQRDSLKSELSKNQSDEITRLNNIILELIKNQNKQVVCQPQNSINKAGSFYNCP